jgi:ABC-type branched-subunit amino acid transport system substrate-binding protein
MDRRAFLKASGTGSIAFVTGCLGNNGGSGGNTDDSNGDSGGESGGTTGTVESQGPIKIGGLEPLSGSFSVWGQVHQTGMEFALDELNNDGGVLGGRELEYVVSDTQSDPNEADSIFTRLVEQENVAAVTGPVSSDVGIRTARTAEDVGVPNMLHMAGSNEVITPETTHTYRIGLHTATNLARAHNQLINEEGVSSVGAIVADYAWGRSYQEAMENIFDIDVQIEVTSVSTSDFTSTLRKFPDDIEMFISCGHPPGEVTMGQQLADVGRSPEYVIGSGFPTGVLAQALSQEVFEAYVPYHMHDTDTETFTEVATRYSEAGNGYLGPNALYGYVTGKVLSKAIENAGSASPTEINSALKSNSYETLYPQPLEWTEYGEFKNQALALSRFSTDPPEYYSDGSYHLNQIFVTDTLPVIEPSE